MPLTIFRKSFLVAVTNPKGYRFFAAVLPQVVDPGPGLAHRYLTLTILFVAIDLAVMAVYAGLGAGAVPALRHRGTVWIDRTFGAAC